MKYLLVSVSSRNKRGTDAEMNYSRVLRNTNILLLLTGFQHHWCNLKSQRFRLTYVTVLNFILLACFYLICFAEQFEPSVTSCLLLLKEISPFLYRLIRFQLMLGLKVFIYAKYTSVRAVDAANAIIKDLQPSLSRFDMSECYAYFLLYSSLGVLFCCGLYIGYEMNFNKPPMEIIFIFLALFIPHLVLGSALRFFNIIVWISRKELQTLTTAVDITHEESLIYYRERLELLIMRLKTFFETLERSLLLLFGVCHGNCLLFGSYSYIYYSNFWYIVFEEPKRRAFYAANIASIVCILCDYACLILTLTLLEVERVKFLNNLVLTIQKRDEYALPKRSRTIVKDLRFILLNGFDFKLFSLWRFNVVHFALLPILQVIITAFIVAYNFLSDVINEHIESSKCDNK